MAEADGPNDINEQLDEITALDSIYGSDGSFMVLNSPDAGGQFSVEIHVPILTGEEGVALEVWLPNDNTLERNVKASFPKAKRPSISRSESGQRLHCSIKVSELPPISLHATLPSHYPSKEPPVFTLSSVWLHAAQLTALCKHLDQLYQHMPVLFTWMDWLQNSTLSFLGLEKLLILTNDDMDEEKLIGRDPRALPEQTNLLDSLTKILLFNYEQELKGFRKEQHECSVCFDVKSGYEFFILPDCGHIICHDCLQGFCQVHVSVGTVQQLSCPQDKCEGSLPPSMIRAVLGDESYERWETLLVQRALDGMGDIVWCPRCNQAVVKEPEETLKLAHCVNCNYSFCTECEEAWHAGKQCQNVLDHLKDVDEDLRKRFLAKIVKGEKITEQDLKQCRDPNKKKLMKSLLESRHKTGLSVQLIKRITKPCPKCHANIQKNGGCNRMTCSNCGEGFCWLCGQKMLSYDHFNSYGPCTLFTTDGTLIVHRPPQRIQHEGQVRVQNMLAEGGEAVRKNVIPCPKCKQRNLKEGRNNHVRCWQCHTQFCYMCREAIDNLQSHYRKPSPCLQHSD